MPIMAQTKTFFLSPSELDEEMVEIMARRPKQEKTPEMPGMKKYTIK